MDPLTKRIDSLEIELAHNQRTVEQLNQVVTAQSQELLKLSRVIDRLDKQLSELRRRPDSSIGPPTLEEEKPPHY